MRDTSTAVTIHFPEIRGAGMGKKKAEHILFDDIARNRPRINKQSSAEKINRLEMYDKDSVIISTSGIMNRFLKTLLRKSDK